MKTVLIIGMGRFGHHLANNMISLGNEVMIVDKDESRLEDLTKLISNIKIGDCTNEDVLQSFGVANFDICFVCIGTNFQSSLEITSLLKELGAKYVISQATRDIHAKFLLKNGADEVIYPNRDSAEKLAVRVSNDNLYDYVELDNEYSIYEISDTIDERLVYDSIASVKIKDGEDSVADLVEGTDYTVEQTTTAEGIEVKLNGIGDFGGSVTKTIKAEDIAVSEAKNLTVEAIEANTLKVSFEGSNLPKEFAQVYDIYVGDKLVAENKEPGEYTFDKINAGNVTVKVVAKRGEVSSEGVSQETKISGIDISKFELFIGEIGHIYNGKEQTVPVTVKNGDEQLEEGTAYEVKYEDNVTSEHCSLARVLIVYCSILASLSSRGTTFVGFEDDKALGLEKDIEQKLFTYKRTGVLGAILLQKKTYGFCYNRYNRNSDKSGRTYYSFACNNKEKKYIVLIAFKTKDGSIFPDNKGLSDSLLKIREDLLKILATFPKGDD